MKSKKPWAAYIVECADKTLYSGITTDLPRRMDQHNGKRRGGAKYTRSRRPVKLVHFMFYEDRSSAAIEEARIKRLTKNNKVKLFFNMLSESVEKTILDLRKKKGKKRDGTR